MHILKTAALLIAASLSCIALSAQEMIPDDPGMTVGKLSNGLTYYLRHNTEKKGCADFYIIHNVGALQEEDNQNGLAHFLEHMAFNGTERYPDKTILEFLEKEGVRFGYNVNAYTSKTETVYNISDVPLVRESFVDSVLFVLHDWSCAISCRQEALDAERGVISEEWRRKDEPRSLMAELQNNLVYKGAKHTRRNVIGTLEIINGFRRDEILDFYHKWYRPDLQAIAIVGDIDAEEMQRRIEDIFSSIPARENPARKEVYEVPSQDGPLFENMFHPMVKVNTLKVMCKQPYPERGNRNTFEFYKEKVLNQVVVEIIRERFARKSFHDDYPAKNVAIVCNEVSSDFYMTLFTISPRNDGLQEEVLEKYAEEIKRLVDHGFSQDELASAKFQASKRLRVNPDQTERNSDWIDSCIDHFLRSEVLISPARKKEYQLMALEQASMQDVQEAVRKMFVDSEKIYSYTIEQGKRDLIPSGDRMKEILADVEAKRTSPEAISFEKVDFSLDVTPGTVEAEKEDTWTMSNGIRVMRMQSEPVASENHLVIKAVFDTGFKALPDDNMESARIAAAYIDRNSGFREYGRKALRNNPESGNITFSTSIGRDEAQITLQCGKEDAEKAFRMLHLILTEPGFDSEQNLAGFKNTQIRSLKKEKTPKALFDEELNDMKYGSHPWRKVFSAEDYELVDMSLVRDVYQRCFGDFSRMKVYICDDMSYEQISGWCGKYIASLKNDFTVRTGEHLASWPLYKGENSLVRTVEMTTVPKSDVRLSFKTDIALTDEEMVVFDVLDYILDARCMDKIREERGGTYSVTFVTEILHAGMIAESSIAFQTRPEMAELLVADALDILKTMAQEGPSEEELDNARKYLTKRSQELAVKDMDNLTKKADRMILKDRYGIDEQSDYISILDRLKSKDIRKTAKKLYNGDRLISVLSEN